MNLPRALVWVLSSAVCTALACRTIPKRDANGLVAPSSSTSAAVIPRLTYVERTLGGTPDEPLPWIVAFHGLGDTPEGFAHVFDNLPVRAHVYLPRAPIAYGSGYDWFGARVADELKLTRGIQDRLPEIAELLEALAARRTNVGDAVVTGFSQGGILSFAIAAAKLEHVKAALPIAGWLPPTLASAPPSTPVIAFHGDADSVVPFKPTQSLIANWQAQGHAPGALEFRSYPGIRHTISAAMHRDWVTALDKAITSNHP